MALRTTIEPSDLRTSGHFGKNCSKTVWTEANDFTCSNGEPSSWASTGSPRTVGSGTNQRLILDNPQGLTTFNAGYMYSTLDGKIDLSGCTNLTSISAYYGSATSLNASGCTNLTYLYCHGNPLTSLDVSGCTNLVNLYCYYNNLTSLDVSGLTSLTTLYCYSNSLTSLDVSGLTNLRVVDCFDNDLTSLNAGGCTNLTNLYCYNNSLTELNVSGCTNLTSLYCFDNSSLGGGLTGLSSLTKINTSKSIRIQRCGFSAAQLDALFATLPDKTVLGGTGTWTIYIRQNPSSGDTSGTTGCTQSIATNRGWVVNTTN
jgi:hypothetical protein